MSGFLANSYTSLIEQGLREDCVQWDWTAKCAKGASGKTGRAQVVSKFDGIFTGESLTRAFQNYSTQSGFFLKINLLVKDGEKIKKGQKIVEFRGDNKIILGLERTYLNLVSYQCGVSNTTFKMVQQIHDKWKSIASSKKRGLAPPRLTATRKILPGYRDLTIEAVLAGGGFCHRLNLGSGILIKENHIEVFGGVTAVLKKCQDLAPHGLKIEIEVKNLLEFKKAILHQADIIMLDNFSVDQVLEALKLMGQYQGLSFRPKLEISGGIHQENVSAYVIPGVDILSSGSISHSVKSSDLSLLIE